MNLKLQVYFDGSDEGVAQLKEFKQQAKSAKPLSFWVVKNADTLEHSIDWVREEPQTFSMQAFFPLPDEVVGDMHLAYNITNRWKESAIKAWNLEGKISCTSASMFNEKYNCLSFNDMYERYTGLKQDFFSVDIIKSTRETIIYKLEGPTKDYDNAFIKLSKKYPLLTFKMRLKRPDWYPGDVEDYMLTVISEYENGRHCYQSSTREKVPVDRSHFSISSERRNIWNVIDSHLDEEGNLSQPPNELPNGTAVEGRASARPMSRFRFSEALMQHLHREDQSSFQEEIENTIENYLRDLSESERRALEF